MRKGRGVLPLGGGRLRAARKAGKRGACPDVQGPSRLSTTRMPGTMDDLNPADFPVLQPYLDPVRVKRGLREKVLDDASGLFPCGLVLFEDN